MAIRSFRNRALADLWSLGDASGVPALLLRPLTQTLHRLEAANKLADLAVMGVAIRSLAEGRYAAQVAPAWDLTFAHDWFFLALDLERRSTAHYRPGNKGFPGADSQIVATACLPSGNISVGNR